MPELKEIKMAHSNSFCNFILGIFHYSSAVRITNLFQNCVLIDILISAWRSYARRNSKYTTVCSLTIRLTVLAWFGITNDQHTSRSERDRPVANNNSTHEFFAWCLFKKQNQGHEIIMLYWLRASFLNWWNAFSGNWIRCIGIRDRLLRSHFELVGNMILIYGRTLANVLKRSNWKGHDSKFA